LLHFMSESNYCKDALYIYFNHSLFEVMIDFEQECGPRLFLVQSAETRRILRQGAK
jgi:hypothetical protein